MPDSIPYLCDSGKCYKAQKKARLSLDAFFSLLKSFCQLLSNSSLKMCCCSSFTQLEVRWLTSRTSQKILLITRFCNELLVT